MKTSRFVLVVFLLIIAIALLLIQVLLYKQQIARCVSNPLVYGVKQLSIANNQEVQCMCSSNKPNSNYLLVTKDNMTSVTMGGLR